MAPASRDSPTPMPEEPADAGQDDGLDEELFQDGAAGGADRFADPDFHAAPDLIRMRE